MVAVPRIPADLARAIDERYADRPDTLADVRANALEWERLKAMALAHYEPEEAA